MASAQRAKILNDSNKFSKNPKKAAVLAAFYPDQKGDTHLLLIKRQGGQDVHAHQIALPGGQYEPSDLDLKTTALREAYEEVGILPAQISCVRALTAVYHVDCEEDIECESIRCDHVDIITCHVHCGCIPAVAPRRYDRHYQTCDWGSYRDEPREQEPISCLSRLRHVLITIVCL